MRLAARLVIVAVGLLLVMTSVTEASAHPGITGYSGKPYNGASETCTTNCHAKGGVAPALTITVPATVLGGSTTVVTLVVAGNKVRTSMNVAFSEGVKTTKGSNTDTPLAAQEPTEIGAIVPPPNGATSTYKFSFTAPSSNGTITMWVAGMAASGVGTGGDGVANTTRTILVTAAVPDAGADASAAPDAGKGASDSGDLHDAGGSEAGAPETSSGRASSDHAGDTGGGCAVASPARSSRGGTALTGAAALAALVMLGLRRRRLERNSP